MTDKPLDTKHRILTNAYDLFYRSGFARVSVDDIAEAANVTKRTIYYHYKSKDDLAAAVLENQHHQALRHIQSWGSSRARTPGGFLDHIFQELEKWAAQPGWLGSGFSRMTMELADRPGHPARKAARHHKLAVENWLCQELTRLKCRDSRLLSRQITMLLEGCLVLVLIYGDVSYVRCAQKAARALITGSHPAK